MATGELDEFIAELLDRTDEIEGSLLELGINRPIWVHTSEQIQNWITEAVSAWKAGELVP